jgi:nitrate reductase alpha subunit
MAERSSPLLEVHRFLRRGPVNEEGWSQLVAKGRDWERSYRGRWAHDKVVRSTHGVNCTGSCSWQVFVKDGLITWESQAVDYPSTGPEMPEYEPRGCPRGASFSWYTYSPLRLRYPCVRASLLEMFREARRRLGDPVDAWAENLCGDDPPRAAARPRRARFNSPTHGKPLPPSGHAVDTPPSNGRALAHLACGAETLGAHPLGLEPGIQQQGRR